MTKQSLQQYSDKELLSYQGIAVSQQDYHVLSIFAEICAEHIPIVDNVEHDTFGCVIIEGNITQLGLFNRKIKKIPDELGQLKALVLLDLDGNGLTQISEAITDLHNLKTLDLRNNQLQSLPDSISRLTALETLWLENNNINYLPYGLW